MQVIYYVLIGILRIFETFILMTWLSMIFWNFDNLKAMVKGDFCRYQCSHFLGGEIFLLIVIGVLNFGLWLSYDDLHFYDRYAFLICFLIDIFVIAYMILNAYIFNWLKIDSFYEEPKHKNR